MHTERQEIIERYKKIVRNWNESETLIKLFPEKYEEICAKLVALENGASYKIYDAKLDMMRDIMVGICRIQQAHDGTGRALKDWQNDEYEEKTDVLQFVNIILKNKGLERGKQ